MPARVSERMLGDQRSPTTVCPHWAFNVPVSYLFKTLSGQQFGVLLLYLGNKPVKLQLIGGSYWLFILLITVLGPLCPPISLSILFDVVWSWISCTILLYLVILILVPCWALLKSALLQGANNSIHAVVANRCSVRRSLAKNWWPKCCLGAHVRMWCVIRPNNLILHRTLGHTESLAAWWNWQHAVFRTRNSHADTGFKCTIHIYFQIRVQQLSPPSGTYLHGTGERQPSPLSPAQLMLTIQAR